MPYLSVIALSSPYLSLHSMVSVFAFSAGLSRTTFGGREAVSSLTNLSKMPVSNHGMQGRIWCGL